MPGSTTPPQRLVGRLVLDVDALGDEGALKTPRRTA
jgi:hypothetical protein